MNGLGDNPAWRELSAFEVKASRRFTLDCSGLADADCGAVRVAFNKSLCAGLRLLIGELRRFPRDDEITRLGIALVAHFNQHAIPPLRAKRQ